MPINSIIVHHTGPTASEAVPYIAPHKRGRIPQPFPEDDLTAWAALLLRYLAEHPPRSYADAMQMLAYRFHRSSIADRERAAERYWLIVGNAE